MATPRISPELQRVIVRRVERTDELSTSPQTARSREPNEVKPSPIPSPANRVSMADVREAAMVAAASICGYFIWFGLFCGVSALAKLLDDATYWSWSESPLLFLKVALYLIVGLGLWSIPVCTAWFVVQDLYESGRRMACVAFAMGPVSLVAVFICLGTGCWHLPSAIGLSP